MPNKVKQHTYSEDGQSTVDNERLKPMEKLQKIAFPIYINERASLTIAMAFASEILRMFANWSGSITASLDIVVMPLSCNRVEKVAPIPFTRIRSSVDVLGKRLAFVPTTFLSLFSLPIKEFNRKARAASERPMAKYKF